MLLLVSLPADFTTVCVRANIEINVECCKNSVLSKLGKTLLYLCSRKEQETAAPHSCNPGLPAEPAGLPSCKQKMACPLSPCRLIRLPEFYDPTYEYFMGLGIEEIL